MRRSPDNAMPAMLRRRAGLVQGAAPRVMTPDVRGPRLLKNGNYFILPKTLRLSHRVGKRFVPAPPADFLSTSTKKRTDSVTSRFFFRILSRRCFFS